MYQFNKMFKEGGATFYVGQNRANSPESLIMKENDIVGEIKNKTNELTIYPESILTETQIKRIQRWNEH